jgi:hypothetical protein
MTKNCLLVRVVLGMSLIFILTSPAPGQSQTSDTETLVWPEVDGHLQLPSHLRALAFAGYEQGVSYSFQQWYAAAALGYQFKPILREHLRNIDPDKEHYFVFGGGYEFLRTIQSGRLKDENRITIDGTPGFRFPAQFLARDRNLVEFRWIDGAYSTTYRNMLMVERDFLIHRLRFSPIGSAEVFYNGAQHSWNQEWYTAGIEWPYKNLLMIETYYLRENCAGCKPTNWNVGGVTVHFFGSVRKSVTN